MTFVRSMFKLKLCVQNTIKKTTMSKMTASNLVTTEEGTIRGKELTSSYISKRKYLAFQGIPYAQPPIGELRFKDPKPATPWQGVREAVEEAPSCPQKHVLLRVLLGEESNCLALNVYTPLLPLPGRPLMPVLVWIHGGGFTFGSGNTDLHGPDFWMERDVVIVTCNYRLGALGFLSLGTPEVPGNAGLKDQVMVLRWVSRNIAQFCGDPNNVTLFGESAGAASVHYHMISPMSRGLFHRAIMMSGSSLNVWAMSERAVERSFRLGKKLGCKTDRPQELLAFLQSLPAYDIIKNQNRVITEQEKQGLREFSFIPCVEPLEGEGERFLTEHPRTLLQKGLVAPVPLIIGVTDKEGMMILNDVTHSDKYFQTFDKKFYQVVPSDFALPPNAENKIKQFYFADRKIDWNVLNEYCDFIGDVYFYLRIDEAIRLHLACAVAPVYCYSFGFNGQLGLLSWLIRQLYPQLTTEGACHADDVGYMFKYNIPGPPKFSELSDKDPELQVISWMTEMWHHFATTGDPNAPGLPMKWKPAAQEGSAWRGHLVLDKALTVRNTRIADTRMEFWDSLLQTKSKL